MARSSGTMLDRASVVCGDVLKKPVDLAARVAAQEPAALETFVEDTATIVAMELAQVRLLEEVFDVPVRDAMLSFGAQHRRAVGTGRRRSLRDGAAPADPAVAGPRLRRV